MVFSGCRSDLLLFSSSDLFPILFYIYGGKKIWDSVNLIVVVGWMQQGPKELPMQCFIKRNKKNSTFYLYLSLTRCKIMSKEALFYTILLANPLIIHFFGNLWWVKGEGLLLNSISLKSRSWGLYPQLCEHKTPNFWLPTFIIKVVEHLTGSNWWFLRASWKFQVCGPHDYGLIDTW